MKRFSCFISVLLLAELILGGCSAARAEASAPGSAAPQSSSSAVFQKTVLEGGQISKDIVLRKTEDETGEIVVSSNEIARIETRQESSDSGSYSILFTLTQTGAQKFSAATKELAKSEGIIAIWLKHEKIASPHVTAQLTDGRFVLSGTYGKQEINELIQKFSAA